MTVVMTSPTGGLAVGATYTGPLEPWYLAQGYARAQSGPVSHLNERGVLKKDNPMLATNREDPGASFELSGEMAAPKTGFTVTPATGLAAGGTVVTIVGDHMIDVTGVTFGGVAGTALQVVNDKTIKVTTPVHAAGAVNVVVTDPDGSTTKTNGYTYS